MATLCSKSDISCWSSARAAGALVRALSTRGNGSYTRLENRRLAFESRGSDRCHKKRAAYSPVDPTPSARARLRVAPPQANDPFEAFLDGAEESKEDVLQ
jgi:hypothetical protein